MTSLCSEKKSPPKKESQLTFSILEKEHELLEQMYGLTCMLCVYSCDMESTHLKDTSELEKKSHITQHWYQQSSLALEDWKQLNKLNQQGDV